MESSASKSLASGGTRRGIIGILRGSVVAFKMNQYNKEIHWDWKLHAYVTEDRNEF